MLTVGQLKAKIANIPDSTLIVTDRPFPGGDLISPTVVAQGIVYHLADTNGGENIYLEAEPWRFTLESPIELPACYIGSSVADPRWTIK